MPTTAIIHYIFRHKCGLCTYKKSVLYLETINTKVYMILEKLSKELEIEQNASLERLHKQKDEAARKLKNVFLSLL